VVTGDDDQLCLEHAGLSKNRVKTGRTSWTSDRTAAFATTCGASPGGAALSSSQAFRRIRPARILPRRGGRTARTDGFVRGPR
jgi:hypothetical protein